MKFTGKWIEVEKNAILSEVTQNYNGKYCFISLTCAYYLLSFQNVCYKPNNHRSEAPSKGLGGGENLPKKGK